MNEHCRGVERRESEIERGGQKSRQDHVGRMKTNSVRVCRLLNIFNHGAYGDKVSRCLELVSTLYSMQNDSSAHDGTNCIAAANRVSIRTCLSVLRRHLRTISPSMARRSSRLMFWSKYRANRVCPCLLTSRTNLIAMVVGFVSVDDMN